MVDIKKNEELFITVMRWVWRNLLASGVILVCFFFLYNKMNTVESDLKELRTIYEEHDRIGRLFMKRARGDFGYVAYEPDPFDVDAFEEDYDDMIEQYEKISREIDEYLDE